MTESELKNIQKSLNIPRTGLLDEFTEAALRNFQIRNGIKATGLPDNATLEILEKDSNLGTISTDLAETNLSIKKYFLKPDEYFKGPTQKRAIFLHFTAGGSNPISVIDSWERDERGKVATHYVIGGRNLFTLSEEFDGDIIQCMPETGNYGWHLGVGNTALHRESIGIELCNWGPITRSGFGMFHTWNKKRIPGREYETEIGQLIEPFRGYNFYHKITDLQIESLYFLIKKLAKENDIDLEQGLKSFLKEQSPTQAFDFQAKVHSDEIKTGLFCHTNVSPKNKYGNYEKWDLFPQPEIIELIDSL